MFNPQSTVIFNLDIRFDNKFIIKIDKQNLLGNIQIKCLDVSTPGKFIEILLNNLANMIGIILEY